MESLLKPVWETIIRWIRYSYLILKAIHGELAESTPALQKLTKKSGLLLLLPASKCTFVLFCLIIWVELNKAEVCRTSFQSYLVLFIATQIYLFRIQ